jgi:hypothetical protein
VKKAYEWVNKWVVLPGLDEQAAVLLKLGGIGLECAVTLLQLAFLELEPFILCLQRTRLLAQFFYLRRWVVRLDTDAGVQWFCQY